MLAGEDCQQAERGFGSGLVSFLQSPQAWFAPLLA